MGLPFPTFRIKKYKTNLKIIMKNTWKLAFAAFTLFAFTACSSGEENTTTESEMETTDQLETDMEMETTDDTTVLEDTTVNDGVADDIQEEQPPVQ
jgi:hypothetical protein